MAAAVRANDGQRKFLAAIVTMGGTAVSRRNLGVTVTPKQVEGAEQAGWITYTPGYYDDDNVWVSVLYTITQAGRDALDWAQAAEMRRQGRKADRAQQDQATGRTVGGHKIGDQVRVSAFGHDRLGVVQAFTGSKLVVEFVRNAQGDLDTRTFDARSVFPVNSSRQERQERYDAGNKAALALDVAAAKPVKAKRRPVDLRDVPAVAPAEPVLDECGEPLAIGDLVTDTVQGREGRVIKLWHHASGVGYAAVEYPSGAVWRCRADVFAKTVPGADRMDPWPQVTPPRVVIVPCGSEKADRVTTAAGLYTGSYHAAARRAAEQLAGEHGLVLILSALYGLLPLDAHVGPYELRMGDEDAVDLLNLWEMAGALGIADCQDVTVLAGRVYADVVTEIWPHAKRPLDGCAGIGYQLQRLGQIERGEPITGPTTPQLSVRLVVQSDAVPDGAVATVVTDVEPGAVLVSKDGTTRLRVEGRSQIVESGAHSVLLTFEDGPDAEFHRTARVAVAIDGDPGAAVIIERVVATLKTHGVYEWCDQASPVVTHWSQDLGEWTVSVFRYTHSTTEEQRAAVDEVVATLGNHAELGKIAACSVFIKAGARAGYPLAVPGPAASAPLRPLTVVATPAGPVQLLPVARLAAGVDLGVRHLEFQGLRSGTDYTSHEPIQCPGCGDWQVVVNGQRQCETGAWEVTVNGQPRGQFRGGCHELEGSVLPDEVRAVDSFALRAHQENTTGATVLDPEAAALRLAGLNLALVETDAITHLAGPVWALAYTGEVTPWDLLDGLARLGALPDVALVRTLPAELPQRWSLEERRYALQVVVEVLREEASNANFALADARLRLRGHLLDS